MQQTVVPSLVMGHLQCGLSVPNLSKSRVVPVRLLIDCPTARWNDAPIRQKNQKGNAGQQFNAAARYLHRDSFVTPIWPITLKIRN
jgi:hypothetical protein